MLYAGALNVLVQALLVSGSMSEQSMLSDIRMENASGWSVELSRNWDVLGPFPIHAREQYFMSPAFPLNLSTPYEHDANRSWTSSYADGGSITWRTALSAEDGSLAISFPDVRWAALRSTEGWAGLQHHAILRSTLTLRPPAHSAYELRPPRLLVTLKQGSYFAVIPRDVHSSPSSTSPPRWYAGSIYDMERGNAQPIDLASEPSLDGPTRYDFFVSGDYEIRLFGDPRVAGSDMPTLALNVTVEAETKRDSVVREPSLDVICDFVDNFALGDALGIGLRSVDGWWVVKDIISSTPPGISLTLLRETRIAPSQRRIVPIKLTHSEPYQYTSITFKIVLISSHPDQSHKRMDMDVRLHIRHVPMWSAASPRTLMATYFFSESHPTAFLTTPPMDGNDGIRRPPILALHGAGVDVLTHRFWAESIPRQKHSWIIIPTGRTSWGLDWHGLSASEAWASIDALHDILENNVHWRSWQLESDAKVLVMGHSNGGQGAWYIGSRYPDRVLGVVAAASYLKSQSYIPLTQSRANHYIDPMLRAILESSLTPDDNDLFLSNVAYTPVLGIHGGDDENVPTWHTREYYSIVKSWNNDANITFREDVAKPHWYPGLFQSSDVQSFIDSALTAQTNVHIPKSFTLTVANPIDSGSLFGWKILKLKTCGRLARLHVTLEGDVAHVRTVNVQIFALDTQASSRLSKLHLNRRQTLVINDPSEPLTVACTTDETWLLYPSSLHISSPTLSQQKQINDPISYSQSPAGRMQNFLRSSGPLTIVVSKRSYEHTLSIALRYAHQLDVYLKLDVEILTDEEADLRLSQGSIGSGNIVIIGGIDNTFGIHLLESDRSEFGYAGNMLHLRGIPLDEPSLGILFTHPHPLDSTSMAVFLIGNDEWALERAFRLLPYRTGVAVPDWVLIGEDSEKIGAAGIVRAGVWNDNWRWNEPMSWMP